MKWNSVEGARTPSHHRIPCYKQEQQRQPWMNLTDAAALLDISPRTRDVLTILLDEFVDEP